MARLILILSSLIFLAACRLDCIDKKTGLSRYSKTKQFSKENGLYKMQMVASKSIVYLPDGNILKINDAWVEDGWHYACINNDPVIQPDTFLHLVVQSECKNDTSDYVLWGKFGGNGIGGTARFAYNLSDTMSLLLKRGNVVIDIIHFNSLQK